MVDGKTNAALALERLTKILGVDFLGYVLSIPVGQSPSDVTLTSAQEQVIEVLARHALPQGDDEFIGAGAFMQASRLTSHLPDGNSSIINLLRTITGGEVETVEPVGDEFVDAVTALARDAWPAYLIRPRGDGPRTFWMSTPVGVYDNPSFARAVDAFTADSRLMNLFPHLPEDSDASGGALGKAIGYQSLVVTNGQSGTLQLSGLISNVLSSAVFRCLIAAESLSLNTLAPHIASVAEDLRKLATGETVRVPALVGFAGVQLPEGSSLEFPEGRLRPPSDADRELFLAGTASLASVLETTFPVRIYSIQKHLFEGEDPFGDYWKFQARIAEASRSFAHMVDLIRLSLVLASPAEKPWLAREVARYIPDPLAHGGTSFWDPGFATVPTFELPPDQFDAVRDWHSFVKSKHMPSLDIGMRRLLSAATTRTEAIDAFVDAVICWESLFGVHTETTFRVTASIAKLLEPSNLARREALHKELKDLYSKRSRLVHGGPEPTTEDVDRFRQRAIDVAADCFRALYRDRADLIELSSNLRGAKLLLE